MGHEGMSRPKLLDLFCGAGGASMGYHRAGFDVVGVDIAPQPHYPFEFHQADALTFPLDGFDAVAASPVCKRHSRITRTAVDPSSHPDLVTPTRLRLLADGRPFVIENVPEAPLVDPITLCGSMFDLDVMRHRCFETNWGLGNHHWPCRHGIWSPRFSPNRSDAKKNPSRLSRVVGVYGGGGGHGQRAEDRRRAMGIEWMNRDELAQAIPPAYTEWIGSQLLATLEAAA
jgi:DNA (cytosine-5)-methyltransferase 1